MADTTRPAADQDFVAVLGDWRNDGPLHVELVAEKVADKAAGFEALTARLVTLDTTRGRGGVVAYTEGDGTEDDPLVVSVEVTHKGASINLILKIERERIEDAAYQVFVTGRPEGKKKKKKGK